MKTVRVRIAVIMFPDRDWIAIGGSSLSDKDKEKLAPCLIETDGRKIHWIESDVPLPENPVIEGKFVDWRRLSHDTHNG